MTILFNLSFGKFSKPTKTAPTMNKHPKKYNESMISRPSQRLGDIPEHHQIKQKFVQHVTKSQARTPNRTISFSLKSIKTMST